MRTGFIVIIVIAFFIYYLPFFRIIYYRRPAGFWEMVEDFIICTIFSWSVIGWIFLMDASSKAYSYRSIGYDD